MAPDCALETNLNNSMEQNFFRS